MLSKARVARLLSLSRRQVREREGRYLLEGGRLVREALLSGAAVEEVLLTPTAAATPLGSEVHGLAKEAGVASGAVSDRDCRRIADTKTPQGILAVVRREDPDPALPTGPGLVLALDGVADPGNVGTLVRSADAFACRAVVAGPGTADFENPKTLRASMGSTFHVPTVRSDDFPAALARMKGAGATIFAAVFDGEDPYETAASGDFMVLVLGNEARGVSGEALALADRRLTIPTPGRAESLNVATAGAILMSLLARRGEVNG